MAATDLSVCILTHSQPELLPRCVESCVSEIGRAGVVGEIIVVDNASSDGYPESVAHASSLVRVIRTKENLGFGEANNIAIRDSRGRYLLILNDDTCFRQGSLSLLVKTLDAHPAIGIVGPKLVNPDGSVQAGYTNKGFPTVRGEFFDMLIRHPLAYRYASTRVLFTMWKGAGPSGQTDVVAGACLLVRREVLDGIGLFDEGFRYLYEDTDLCHRAKKAGWGVFYLAEAEVVHYGSASLNQWPLSDRTLTHFRSQTRYFAKHSNGFKRLLVRVAAVSALLLRLPVTLLVMAIRGRARNRAWRTPFEFCSKALGVLLQERGS